MRFPDRFPLSPALAAIADGGEPVVVDDAPRTREQIVEDVLEAVADEIHLLLEEGVVAEAADVDTGLLLGAGWPFFLGGITKHLDQTACPSACSAARLPTWPLRPPPESRLSPWPTTTGESGSSFPTREARRTSSTGSGLRQSDADELADELREHRLAVSQDGDTMFVYASTGMQAEQAARVIESELNDAG